MLEGYTKGKSFTGEEMEKLNMQYYTAWKEAASVLVKYDRIGKLIFYNPLAHQSWAAIDWANG